MAGDRGDRREGAFWWGAALHVLAGSSAGVSADAVTHPMDTMRTRMMQASGVRLSFVRLLASTLTREGVRGFYRGFSVVAAASVPAHGLYFGGYETAKRVLQPHRSVDEMSTWNHLLAGFVADICGSVVWVPQDVLKQRLQVQRSRSAHDAHYRGSVHALRTVLREEGVRGLYKGFLAGIATYGPFVAVYFASYERCRAAFRDASRGRWASVADLPGWANFVAGFLGGGFAAAITTPMDVVKTRLQVESSLKVDRYRGIRDAVVRTFRSEGLRAFSKGLVPRVLWIAPNTALTIFLYEHYKRWYQRHLPVLRTNA